MLLPDRFIPTYVGHTRWYHGCMRASAVHPHIRGAYRVAGSLQKASAGSSPHTWGIHADQPLPGAGRRFIPTYVGHTWADLLKFMSRTVHPHIRGAYSICGRRPAQSAGSSPPTWGIHPEAVVRPTVGRFIPTYVGHTASSSTASNRATGSSPHTWGIRWLDRRGVSAFSVHPHIRGAYGSDAFASAPTSGSSPHTWGIPRCSSFFTIPSRFIPTYVGHTDPMPLRPLRPPVHPHIRGAYPVALHFSPSPLGSSPHTWGIRTMSNGSLHS